MRTGMKDYVKFHGFLPQAVVAELLRASNAMVLPSMRECGGAVVLEAMASGVPVIAANWGGPVDYISEGAGFLIPPDTPEEFVKGLARAMVWLSKNPEVGAQIGQAARARALQLYDWPVRRRCC